MKSFLTLKLKLNVIEIFCHCYMLLLIFLTAFLIFFLYFIIYFLYFLHFLCFSYMAISTIIVNMSAADNSSTFSFYRRGSASRWWSVDPRKWLEDWWVIADRRVWPCEEVCRQGPHAVVWYANWWWVYMHVTVKVSINVTVSKGGRYTHLLHVSLHLLG